MNNDLNEILKKFDEEIKKVELIRNPYSEKNEKFKKCLIYLSEEYCNIFEDTLDYITNLQQRIDKAIEYIEKNTNFLYFDKKIEKNGDIKIYQNTNVNELLDILKGEETEQI